MARTSCRGQPWLHTGGVGQRGTSTPFTFVQISSGISAPKSGGIGTASTIRSTQKGACGQVARRKSKKSMRQNPYVFRKPQELLPPAGRVRGPDRVRRPLSESRCQWPLRARGSSRLQALATSRRFQPRPLSHRRCNRPFLVRYPAQSIEPF